MRELARNVKVTRVMTAQVAGTSDTLSGDIIDMEGFEGVMFIAEFGTLTNGAVTTLKSQQNTANSSSGMADLEGTSVSIDAANDNDCLVLDLYRPQERYIRPQIVRATANAVVDSVLAIQYGARTLPTTNSSTTVASTEVHVSPDEGTA